MSLKLKRAPLLSAEKEAGPKFMLSSEWSLRNKLKSVSEERSEALIRGRAESKIRVRRETAARRRSRVVSTSRFATGSLQSGRPMVHVFSGGGVGQDSGKKIACDEKTVGNAGFRGRHGWKE